MTHPKMRNLMAIVFVLSAPMCWAQEKPSGSLDGLLAEAHQNNPEIRAAQKKIQEAKALIPQAWGLDNPMLKLENDNTKNNPFDSREADQERIGFSQTIPFPAKLFVRAEAAGKEFAMAQAQLDQTVNDVNARVRKAYADLYQIVHTRALLEESRKALESFREIATRKYSVGKASQADVFGADVEMGKVMNELALLEGQEISAQAALKALLSRPAGQDVSVAHELGLQPLGTASEDLVGQALKVNPQLRSISADVAKAQAGLTLAHLEYAPDVEISTEYRQMDGTSDLWDGFLGVSVPLWLYKQQAMIAGAKAALDKKKDELVGQRNETARAVQDSYARAQSAWHVISNLNTLIIPQAEQTLNVSQTAYETDKIDFSSLIGYWRALLGYRVQQYQAMTQYHHAMADLELAVGAGGGDKSPSSEKGGEA